MRPFLTNGQSWRVLSVEPGDPRLVDREGRLTLGTADPSSRTIHISSALVPPMLDRVLLHEVAHAVAISNGMADRLRDVLPERYWIWAEEWAASMMEAHSLEAAAIASESIGRPLCVRGYCG